MSGDHFYTTSRSERDRAFAFLDYVEEGAACFVFDASTPGPGTTAFFRFYNPSSGDHFYTASPSEGSHAVTNSGYQAEGIACYVFSSPEPGTTPLYRMYNPTTGDHLYTTSLTESNNAIFTFGYQSEPVACHVFDTQTVGTTPLYRLVQASLPSNPNAAQSPWAVLLCKFKDDNFEPPAAAGVPSWRTVCDQFFTEANATYNNVKFFSDMSHGKLDLTGSQVLGWYEIDVKITGRTSVGDPNLSKTQDETIALAKKAAKDAGVAIDKFAGVIVIMNQATGWAQGSPGAVAMDWRRVDGRSFDGTLGARAAGGGNGMEAFGQEVGHGYGLDHSRMDGSNIDYLDKWDTMSTLSQFSTSDPDYGARGPGLNAWNMRCRGWLDETRIWKPASKGDFSEVIQLRPLHQRILPGWLGAELPGIGNHSPYLVEFRMPELWDAGFGAASVFVHRFSGAEENGQVYSPGLLGQALGTHSYVMANKAGGFSLAEGDTFEIGTGPFTRVKVLTIDAANRIATLQVCHCSSAQALPTVKVHAVQVDDCYPALTEGAVAKFAVSVAGVQCSESYKIAWTATGASPVAGLGSSNSTYSLTLPDPATQVTVTATITMDEGQVIADSLQFHPFSLSEASFREFICKLRRERMKPIPWWEWDPERLREIASHYSRAELALVVRSMDVLLQRLKVM